MSKSYSLRSLLFVFMLGPGLSSCAVSTPFKLRKELPPDEWVVASYTFVALDQQKRSVFDRYTRRIAATLDQQEGLIGYSLRLEIFGNRAWTHTVWESDEAVMRFVNSRLHTEGMEKSEPAVLASDFVRTKVRYKETPVPWDEILKTFESRKVEARKDQN